MIAEFLEYQPHKGPLKKSQRGALVSSTEGVATPYGIKELEKHGTMFIKPGQKVTKNFLLIKSENISFHSHFIFCFDFWYLASYHSLGL